MSIYTPERPDQAKIDKLPKWAQEYLDGIEKSNQNLSNQNARLQGDLGAGHHCNGVARLAGSHHESDDIPLDDRVRVVFKTSTGEIEVGLASGILRAYERTASHLSVEMDAANVITIMSGDRRMRWREELWAEIVRTGPVAIDKMSGHLKEVAQLMVSDGILYHKIGKGGGEFGLTDRSKERLA